MQTTPTVSSSAGSIEETCASLPFGDGQDCAFASGAYDATEHHFAGYQRDTESGNDYAQARYYASLTGRFLSPDPSTLAYADPTNPQSFNPYSYALNNPLTLMDPLGLDGCTTSYGSYNPATGKPFDTTTYSGCISSHGIWLSSSPGCVDSATVFCLNINPYQCVDSASANCQDTVFGNEPSPLNPEGSGSIGGVSGDQGAVANDSGGAPNNGLGHTSPVDQANNEFNQCVAQKTQPAAVSSYVDSAMAGKTDVVVPAVEGLLDANQDCVNENPLAILSSQYHGLFGASDLPVWWHGIDIHYF